MNACALSPWLAEAVYCGIHSVQGYAVRFVLASRAEARTGTLGRAIALTSRRVGRIMVESFSLRKERPVRWSRPRHAQ